MKTVLVLALACIALCIAIPIDEITDVAVIPSGENLSAEPKTTLTDLEQVPIGANVENENRSNDNNELARPKRFILKKLLLAKAGLLGLG